MCSAKEKKRLSKEGERWNRMLERSRTQRSVRLLCSSPSISTQESLLRVKYVSKAMLMIFLCTMAAVVGC